LTLLYFELKKRQFKRQNLLRVMYKCSLKILRLLFLL